ncbi:MAG: DMT family transporter [Candidatus Babeliaceae bacterium]
MILLVILYALLAATFLLAKIAVAYADPFFLIGFRMITAGIILLSYYFFIYKGEKKLLTRSLIKPFIAIIFFHIYFSFVPEFWALHYVSSIKVNIMYSITPFITTILAYYLLKERLSLLKIAGILSGFFGLLPVLIGKNDEMVVTEIFAISLPEIMLLFSIVSGAYAWFLIKRLMDKGYSLILINGMSMLWGGFLSMLTWGFYAQPNAAVVYNWHLFLLTVAGLIVMSNIVVYGLYAWLTQKYSLTLIAFAGFLCPLFGALYGTVLLGEHLYWYHGIALIGITFGLFCFYRDTKNPVKIYELENI